METLGRILFEPRIEMSLVNLLGFYIFVTYSVRLFRWAVRWCNERYEQMQPHVITCAIPHELRVGDPVIYSPTFDADPIKGKVVGTPSPLVFHVRPASAAARPSDTT